EGAEYSPFYDLVEGVMPFPGWEPFEGPDSADLGEAAKARLAADAVAVPGAVAHGIVRYSDDRRTAVPVTLVCPEYSPEQAQEWLAGGSMPELSAVTHLSYADIDSGHWPMTTKPTELAALLAAIVAAAQG
ncbi:MAG: hypothetical protein WCC60_09830, partial [Ilumatobacteraceae bacterium]